MPVKGLKTSSHPIAVAVSGGPDSMALLHMLAAQNPKTSLHALTVDHGLRTESADEAAQVGAWIADWPRVRHHVLTWKGRKPASGIQEQARAKRYEMMAAYCAEHGIRRLYLAHHRGDQAETFLFRLAKGSGLDGLAGMAEESPYRDTGLILVRPLLDKGKDELAAYCRTQDIPFVQDPSNANAQYARVRLRQAMPVLEAEGLSEKRLAVTAARLQRAREALDFYTERLLRSAASVETGRTVFDLKKIMRAPEDIRIRAVRAALARMGGDGYGPRLDRLEDLLAGVFDAPEAAKRFTLGGFVFTPDVRRGRLSITRE